MNLKKILRANGLFSSISGITLLLSNEGIGSLLQYRNDLLYLVLGSGLLIFGSFLIILSKQQKISNLIISIIILMDFTWVLGSLIILMIPGIISIEGKLLIAGLAIIVSGLATAQAIAQKKSN